jgi:hypothetical protein
MAQTPHMALALLEQSQAQKEVTLNEALFRLDAILNSGAIDKDLSAPPASPAEGDVYIVGASASADWLAQENAIAYFHQIWRFITPNAGLLIWLQDEQVFYVFNGSAWQKHPADITALQNATAIGINTTADSTNKLAVASDAVLLSHNGSNMQVVLNKNALADTASFVFQTAFSARAEFGLTGNDNFTFKVTPDNFTTSFEAFVIESNTGLTRFRENTQCEKNFKVDGFLSLPDPSILTIATGAVSLTKSHHKIDTELAAASDDLLTLNGGSSGDVVILQAADAARSVVIKHAAGNIRNFSGADITLDDYGKAVSYFYDGFNWIQF